MNNFINFLNILVMENKFLNFDLNNLFNYFDFNNFQMKILIMRFGLKSNLLFSFFHYGFNWQLSIYFIANYYCNVNWALLTFSFRIIFETHLFILN